LLTRKQDRKKKTTPTLIPIVMAGEAVGSDDRNDEGGAIVLVGTNARAGVGLRRKEMREEEENSVTHYHQHTDDTTYNSGPGPSVSVVDAEVVDAEVDGDEVVGTEYFAHVTPSFSAMTLSICPL